MEKEWVGNGLQRITALFGVCRESHHLPSLLPCILSRVVPWLLSLPLSHKACSFLSSSNTNRTTHTDIMGGKAQVGCEEWSQCMHQLVRILLPSLPSLPSHAPTNQIVNYVTMKDDQMYSIETCWTRLVDQVLELGKVGCDQSITVLNEIVTMSGHTSK